MILHAPNNSSTARPPDPPSNEPDPAPHFLFHPAL
jgi:hypothetical protein